MASASPHQPELPQRRHRYAKSTIWAARSIAIGTGLTWFLGAMSLLYYPGGNHFDAEQVGYSFSRNYICDSLSTWGYNGQRNLVGSRLAAAAFLSFIWLALLPVWAFLLNEWIRSKTFKWFMVFLSIFSATGLSLLPLKYQLELPIGHDLIVWLAVIPTLLASFLFVMTGWRLRLFPPWLLGLASCAVLAMFADLGVWAVRVLTHAEPSILEPVLMKLAMMLVITTVSSLAFLPRFEVARPSAAVI